MIVLKIIILYIGDEDNSKTIIDKYLTAFVQENIQYIIKISNK